MKHRIFSRTVSIIVALAAVACAPHNPAKPDDPVDAKALGKRKSGNPPSDVAQTPGQPGKISLFGSVAEVAGSKLVLVPQAGLGADGKATPVTEENQPLLSEKLPDVLAPKISDAALAKSYAFGCDDKQISQYLERGSGKADSMSPEELKDFNAASASVTAGKVLVCGANSISASTQITINARDVILYDATLTHRGAAGISIQAENLTLVGKNEINSLTAEDASTSQSSQSGPVKIVVTKNTEFKDDGKLNGSLKITSQGASVKKK